MMCKLCIKCKEFVSVHQTYLGRKRVDLFDRIHSKHPRVFIDSNELDGFNCVNDRIDRLMLERIVP